MLEVFISRLLWTVNPYGHLLQLSLVSWLHLRRTWLHNPGKGKAE